MAGLLICQCKINLWQIQFIASGSLPARGNKLGLTFTIDLSETHTIIPSLILGKFMVGTYVFFTQQAYLVYPVNALLKKKYENELLNNEFYFFNLVILQDALFLFIILIYQGSLFPLALFPMANSSCVCKSLNIQIRKRQMLQEIDSHAPLSIDQLSISL